MAEQDVKIAKFLLVDESDANRLFFEMLLKSMGISDVTNTRTGGEALVLIERIEVQFAIVAWELGAMPGTIFIQRMRASRKRRHVPFVIYSRRFSPADMELLKDLGIENVLSMPFDRALASQLISRLISEEEGLSPIQRTLRRLEDQLQDRRAQDVLQRLSGRLMMPGPYQYKAFTIQGEAFIQLGKYDKAEASLKDALSLRGDYQQACRLLAKAKSLAGKHDEAIEILKKIADKSPLSIATKMSLGSAYVKANRIDEAEVIFEECSLLDAEAPGLKDELGQVAFAKGNIGLATELLSQTQNGDEIAATFNNLAVAWVAKGEIARGIETYQNAMKILSSKAKLYILHYNLGLAMRKNGDLPGALQAFAASYELVPTFEKAYAAFVKGYREAKQNAPQSIPKGLTERVKVSREKYQAALEAREARQAAKKVS